MTGVSIIVPVYNALDETQACIASLYSVRTSVVFEVIVVDNGSQEEVAHWLAANEKERSNFRFLHFDAPLGFARAINEGVRRARFDLLVLLNSDTIVSDGWLDSLASALGEDSTLGIVSPVTNRCGHELQRDRAAASLQPADTKRYAESIRQRQGILPEPQRLVFFCVMLRRALWDRLGGLDEAFRTGNFEDDDFCLRARMAGYRLAVIPNAFVYHHERRTFESNQLDHGEWLSKNQALFAERASRWSRAVAAPFPRYARADSVSVIVPVVPQRAQGLRDSLASLANQTVEGFETLVIHPRGVDISSCLEEFAGRLRLNVIETTADVLNSGLSSAAGTKIAYLPAADIFYPFHLEVLIAGLAGYRADAVYTAWNVVVNRRRGCVLFPEAEPDIELGDWAPLLCWLHKKTTLSQLRFESESAGFAPWRFLINLRRQVKTVYLCRVTCERQPDPPTPRDAADVQRIMQLFPVNDAWKETQRRQFSEAVKRGDWEDRLIVSHHERARRVHSLLRAKGLSLLRKKLADAAAVIQPAWRDCPQPDIFLFSIVEWAGLTQRPHHFASGLAARGHRVFWVDVRFRSPEMTELPQLASDLLSRDREGADAQLARQVQPGIWRVTLPAFENDVYRLPWRPEVLDTFVAAFAYLRAAYGISSAVQLVNFPRWEPLVSALAGRFAWKLVYDCLDDQQSFSQLFGHDLKQDESQLIETSSAVIASGKILYDALRTRRPDTVLIPNAADFDLFHEALPAGRLHGLPHPVIGFFGAFADWLDFDWIDAAARRFPQWSFVYIGVESFARPSSRERWRAACAHSNVHVYPLATPRELAQYLAEFDVCTMPFQDLPVTRSMNPVKLFEYLAAGKPIVAPDLPEVRPLCEAGLVAVYRNIEESFRLLEEAVAQGGEVNARVVFAAQNTWRHRVAALASVIDRVSGVVQRDAPL